MIFSAIQHSLFASLLVLAACSSGESDSNDSDKDTVATKPDTPIVKPAIKDASTDVADKAVEDATNADAKTTVATDAAEGESGSEPSVDEPAGKGISNIKALPAKWSDKQVKRYMVGITKALGEKCSYCHVKGDYASDDNKHKIAARKMIAMTRSLDRRFMGGKGLLTCKTCHNGKATP